MKYKFVEEFSGYDDYLSPKELWESILPTEETIELAKELSSTPEKDEVMHIAHQEAYGSYLQDLLKEAWEEMGSDEYEGAEEKLKSFAETLMKIGAMCYAAEYVNPNTPPNDPLVPSASWMWLMLWENDDFLPQNKQPLVELLAQLVLNRS